MTGAALLDYDRFARRLVETGIITDPWLAAAPRFASEPVILPVATAKRLAQAATQLAEVYEEGVRLVADEPQLLDDFFALTPLQKVMFASSFPLWHGIGRADLFLTSDGDIATTELNCDTPTGEAEAVILGELACADLSAADRARLVDPNCDLARQFLRMLDHMRRSSVGEAKDKTVGIIYPTEFTEDLALVRIYRRWLEEAGYEVVLGSPYNLQAGDDGEVCLFDRPISVVVRHYKTDWWSERASAWSDEQLADPLPLRDPLSCVLEGQQTGRVAVINPFGSVLPQNKRMMAFMWEYIHRFTLTSQEIIRSLVPFTQRLEAFHPAQLRGAREKWVLKSDYGAEGEEVIIGKETPDVEWMRSIDLARRGRWVAQQYFEAERDAAGRAYNYGVFLVGGLPAGLYLRTDVGPTDDASLSVPVLLEP